MMNDGNVITPDCWKSKPPKDMPMMKCLTEVLYADEHAHMIRMTWQIGENVYMQHFASGAGLDD